MLRVPYDMRVHGLRLTLCFLQLLTLCWRCGHTQMHLETPSVNVREHCVEQI